MPTNNNNWPEPWMWTVVTMLALLGATGLLVLAVKGLSLLFQ